ncbi:methyltransferase family protein [Simplicispira lacusdiani]|uniref:methyltransferase family protein n=1 Tax=Simplicispira lacusdiani TaxID=2213010 RepID=UPI000E744B18|nr:isoprenylcysteine carboxylmethyltransferase family protein [Simplicispira lacusdiani]
MLSLKHRVPPPLVALALLPAMWLLSGVLPTVDAALPVRLGLAAGTVLAGLGFSLAGVLAFRRASTTVNPLHPERAAALVTTGVYRITRNPMYVGMVLVLLAWAVLLASPVALAGPVVFIAYMNRFQIGPEEQALGALFGPEYAAYRSRVRRWI